MPSSSGNATMLAKLSGNPISTQISSVTAPATNNGTSVTYDTNGDFESLGAGDTATATFTYTISDGHGGTSIGTVHVTITPVNDPPNAINDGATTPIRVWLKAGPQAIAVLANDTWLPDAPETLRITKVTQGGHGTVAITGSGTGHINGNLGNDLIEVTAGTNDVHGGQGNDTIIALGGSNDLMGDLGDDVIAGGSGSDTMTGGAGADLFVLIGMSGHGASPVGGYDEVTDYQAGIDHLHVNAFTGNMLPTVLHAEGGASFADFNVASAYAATLLAAHSDAPTNEVAALQVGSDTFLFYSNLGFPGDMIDSAVKLDHVSAAGVTVGDFVTTSLHL